MRFRRKDENVCTNDWQGKENWDMIIWLTKQVDYGNSFWTVPSFECTVILKINAFAIFPLGLSYFDRIWRNSKTVTKFCQVITLRRTDCERDGCGRFVMKLIESSEDLYLNSRLILNNYSVYICLFHYHNVFTSN